MRCSHPPACHHVKEQICEVGRRMWQREYVDGNGGNIAVRVGEDLAICTPTLVSKGFMHPDDLCLVDFDGNQLAGTKGRTSEILMHLQIMARQPRAVATVHCHPPYATGFAVVGLEPPTCLVPEYEIFASVAIAPYRTPGTPAHGQARRGSRRSAQHRPDGESRRRRLEPEVRRGRVLQDGDSRGVLPDRPRDGAAWQAAQHVHPPQMQDLLKIKQTLDIPDPRIGLKEANLCDNDGLASGRAVRRSGVCRARPRSTPTPRR